MVLADELVARGIAIENDPTFDDAVPQGFERLAVDYRIDDTIKPECNFEAGCREAILEVIAAAAPRLWNPREQVTRDGTWSIHNFTFYVKQ